MQDPVNVSYESLWQRYRDMRVVTKAREYCRYTLAKLVSEPEPSSAGDSSQQQIKRDYQSIGALLCNNLIARLGEYLFPSNSRFIKLTLKKWTADQMSNEVQVNDALIKIEKAIVERARQNGGYADLLMALAYLCTTGNCALNRDGDGGKYLVYGLESFSVQRDGRGVVTDAIVKERIAWESLPQNFQAMLQANNVSKNDSRQRCWLYTRIKRTSRGKNFGYEITQQLGNYTNVVYTPGEDYYPEKVVPWIFPVWSLKSGEHYGRGQVEDYAGDFARLSNLSESSHLYMQEALRVLHMLTGSGGSIDDIEQADTGAVIPLQQGTTLVKYEVGDYQKVQQARDEITAIVQRLSQAFMYTGEYRDSERTTATEVQQVAQSAERGLGGPYSTASKTFQIPLAYILLAELDSSLVPDIVGSALELQVVAGLDALGRSVEAEALVNALNVAQAAMAAVATVNQVNNVLNPDEVLKTIFSSYGVEFEKYRKSAQQLQQEADANDKAVANANGVPTDPATGQLAPMNPAASISQI